MIIPKMSRIAKQPINCKIVYRIEHPIDNNGPYRSCYTDFDSQLIYDMCEAHCTHTSKKHPTPKKEGFSDGLVDRSLCGSLTLEQLKEWFGDFYERLLKETDFILVKYRVRGNGVHIGKAQVIFERNCIIKRTVINL